MNYLHVCQCLGCEHYRRSCVDSARWTDRGLAILVLSGVCMATHHTTWDWAGCKEYKIKTCTFTTVRGTSYE